MALGLLLVVLGPAAFGAQKAGDGFEAALSEIPGLREQAAEAGKAKSWIGGLTGEPVKFIAEKTYLGDSDAFKKFLQNPAAVDAFLNDKVTAFVTQHGWAVRQVARPAVIKAVIGSPAMSDRKLVSYLFSKTSLPLRLARASGVKESLADRDFVAELCSPELKTWLAANPAAQASLKAQSAPLAEALSRR